ncbi:MAG: hypothetical protein ABSF08_11400 [Candidatus Cybelea sp.]|jgi:hypothetical protein
MRILRQKGLAAAASLVGVQAALLVACSSSQTHFTPLAVQSSALLAPPHASVSPDTPQKFLYVSDWPNSVWSYKYSPPSVVFRFTLAGATFNEPYGQCVDAAGNVFITNYGVSGAGHGKTYRYPHNGVGGPTHTYSNGTASAIGCSVYGANPGDLAVTYYSTAASTGPGEVRIWSGESGTPTTYSGQPSGCYNLWPGGFDSSGNLFVEGEPAGGGAVSVCELTAPPRAWSPLTLGFTIYGPGSVMWDGRYLALTDTQAGNANETAIFQATLSGTLLTVHGETVLSDTCSNDYVDTVQPFILGRHNTPANTRQGSDVIGGNLACAAAGNDRVDDWKYPAGGSPALMVPNPPPSPYGQAVSLP